MYYVLDGVLCFVAGVVAAELLQDSVKAEVLKLKNEVLAEVAKVHAKVDAVIGAVKK